MHKHVHSRPCNWIDYECIVSKGSGRRKQESVYTLKCYAISIQAQRLPEGLPQRPTNRKGKKSVLPH